MISRRLDGLYLFVLGSVAFILLGIAMENAATGPLADFRALYYPARTLLQHSDPYMQSEVLRIYQAEGGASPSETAKNRQIATQNPYPPTTFSFIVPLAMLGWGPAHILWIALTIGGLIIASFLIWNLGADYAPIVSGVLIGFFLANSEVLVITGNAAGIVVSLCVAAVWCFVRNRFVPAGILCLAVSLAIKPHDTGLVWLFFLLAGGIYRKHALQTLLVAVALSLPGVLWVWHVSPNWIQEAHSNLLAYSVHGGINDPGVASNGSHGLAMVVSLQAVICFFWDDPRIYNSVSYLLCAPLLLIWVFVTLRSRTSLARLWLAVASIAALSLLPIYHRQYDAKLLLLTVPACAMLWSERGIIGRAALLINTVAFVLTADIPWVVFFALIKALHLPTTGFSGRVLMAAQVLPVPLIILVVCVFYLWVYARRSSAHTAPSTLDND